MSLFTLTLVVVFLSIAVCNVFACGGGSMSGCGMADMSKNAGMNEPENHMACSSGTMQKYGFLATMPIYMDSPEVLYSQAQELGLSEQQKGKLLSIISESRKNSLTVLTPEQRQKLGAVPDEPITMEQVCPMMHGEQSQPAAVQNLADAKVVEQTTCPVMGGAINKDIFTEYKGKKVYFCCPGCKPKFEKNPEKYIDKLPQFAK